MLSKPKRVLHPKLAAHGAKVAAAHAVLSQRPAFKALPKAHQMRAVQAHIRKGGC